MGGPSMIREIALGTALITYAVHYIGVHRFGGVASKANEN